MPNPEPTIIKPEESRYERLGGGDARKSLDSEAMTQNGNRVPGWPEYLEALKASGVWENPALREAGVREWDRLNDEQRARDEAPILADLHAVGVMVKSVWDIVNLKESFPPALPVLLNHLYLPYPDAVREGLARAMSERAANFAWKNLVKLYQAESSERVRDGLAVALSGAVSPQEMDEFAELIRDKRNGESRVLLMNGLRLLSSEKQLELFKEFARDPQIAPEANEQVKKLQRRLSRTKTT